MILVIIRLFSKLLHLQKLLIENSLIHFSAVCLVSVLFSMLMTTIWNLYKPKKIPYTPKIDRTYAEINLSNLEHNVNVLKEAIPNQCQIMAVVKAEAYGHGAFEISTHLNKVGIHAFAVATIDEGIRLRKYGIQGEILILGYTDIYRTFEIKKYDLTQTLIDYNYAVALNQQNITVNAHIKIDTGMHRLGICDKDLPKIKKIFCMKNIKVCGIYTHLCCADSLKPEDVLFTKEQINRFYCVIDALKKSNIVIPKLHIQSSYGLLNYPELKCDYVRIGIALYGILSSPNQSTVLKLNLRPVLSLKSKVVLIRPIKKGESVGYNRTFTAERDSRIAIIPIGYGDGFPRNLSCGDGRVQIRQNLLPIIGRICMDQLAVDITDADDIIVGDIVTLIGAERNDRLTAPDVAEYSKSISNELLCRLSTRIPIVIQKD